MEGFSRNFGDILKTSFDTLVTETKTQTLIYAKTLAKVQTDALAQTQSLALIQNTTQTEAIAQAQAQTILDELS